MKSKTRKAAGKASLDPLVLPCPFCGASGDAVEHKPFDAGVLCHGCGVWMPSRVSTEPGRSHGALEMWNRRQNAGTEARGHRVASGALLGDESKGDRA